MTQWLVDQLRAGWGPGEFCVSAIPVILPDFTTQLRCEDSRIWWRLSLGTLWQELLERSVLWVTRHWTRHRMAAAKRHVHVTKVAAPGRSGIVNADECQLEATFPTKSRFASPPVVQDPPIDRARGLTDEVGLFTLVNQGVYE